MSRSLAIETSGRVGSIALAREGGVLVEEEFPHGLQHAAQIIPIIDRLTRGQGWSPGQIEELYLSAGPGSFTGLRIGVTLAKAMAVATGVRIVGVPSVRVLVENAPAEAREVIVVLDAKRGQIFSARFGRAKDGGGNAVSSFILHPSSLHWEELEPAHLDDLPSMLARSGRPVHLLGEGIPYHRPFIPDEPGVIVTGEDMWRARASVVGKLGHEMACRGEFTDPLVLTPIYIRVPEAQEKWENK